jgi:cytosine/adenosine deaminase-related metal-dependent hydrolase
VNANLYLENQLPPVEMLSQKGVELVIGTDSYSSNDQLSISAEIRTIRKTYPSIPLENILRWATFNGAKALGGKRRSVVLKKENVLEYCC